MYLPEPNKTRYCLSDPGEIPSPLKPGQIWLGLSHNDNSMFHIIQTFTKLPNKGQRNYPSLQNNLCFHGPILPFSPFAKLTRMSSLTLRCGRGCGWWAVCFAAWGLVSCWNRGRVNSGKSPGSRRWEEQLSEYLKSGIIWLSLAGRIKERHHCRNTELSVYEL